MNNETITIALGATSFVLIVVLYVWAALALSALFRKAGEEGWKGWVPVLNQAVLLQLGGFSPWLILLILIPGLGGLAVFVLYVMAAHRINRSFGYGTGMTVLAALLGLIWASILGFGSARWIAEPAAGPMRSSEPVSPPAPPLVGGWTPSVTPPATPLGPPPAPAATGAGVVGPAAPAPASWAPAFPQGTESPGLPALDRELEDSAVDPEDRVAAATPRPSGSFTPPPLPPVPPAPSTPIVPISSVPGTRSAPPTPPAAVSVQNVPVQSAPVPRVPEPVDEPEPWAPDSARRAPDETFPEPSEAVSAVVGAPDAGAPRSARSSVSALYAQPEIPDDDIGAVAPDEDDEPIDQTIIAKRRRTPWTLVPPSGLPIDIASDVVILGRRPAPDPSYPDAQLVSIPDETRTVSKTHARLELRGETWYVTDLGSTNGVLFATLMGTEVEAQPGQELEAGERFFLGDAEVRLRRSDA